MEVGVEHYYETMPSIGSVVVEAHCLGSDILVFDSLGRS